MLFIRQPNTEGEIDEAILGLWASCCGAIRYAGKNRKILTRLAELGLAEQCDYPLDKSPKRISRNHLCFEYWDGELEKDNSTIAQVIMDFFVHSLPQQIGNVRDFRCSMGTASFRYEWGDRSQPHLHSILFVLEPRNERHWLLRMLRNENATTAFAVSIHKAVRQDSRFRRIQWFSEEEWEKDENGVASPY